MPARGTTARKRTAAKAPAAATKAKPGPKPGTIRKLEPASKATFSVDDKRAQYARLAVFNYAVKQKMVGKSVTVDSISNEILEKAGKELAGGNLLYGKDGLQYLADLTMNGATDEKVAKRGLTPAYAAEVRPFIRKLLFADGFERRAGAPRAKKEPAKKEPKSKTAPAETPAETPAEAPAEAESSAE